MFSSLIDFFFPQNTLPVDNGFNPVWNETCEFDIINPDMALIRFVVQDVDMFGDPNFLGQASYPVKSIRTGYHSVPLKNGFSEELELAALLVHTDLRNPRVRPTLMFVISPHFLPPDSHLKVGGAAVFPGADCPQSSTIPPLCLSRCRLPPVFNHSTLMSLQVQTAPSLQPFHPYVSPGADCPQSSTIPPLCLSRCRLPPVFNHSTLMSLQVQTAPSLQPFHPYVSPGADCPQSSTIPPLCLSRCRLPPVFNHSTLMSLQVQTAPSLQPFHPYVSPGADCPQSSTILPLCLSRALPGCPIVNGVHGQLTPWIHTTGSTEPVWCLSL